MESRFHALWLHWMSTVSRRVSMAGWLALGAGLLLWGLPLWGRPQAAVPPAASLTLTASAFRANGEIPARFSCDGDDTSPGLSWTDPPAGTRTFALAVVDPDAPGGNLVHWLIYDLPASTRALPEAVAQGPDAAGGHQGTNGFGHIGYNGPCPPAGSGHRYLFRLFALDSVLNLEHATVQDLQSTMKGHILAQAEIVGVYRR
ncbi:MAG TPA: YbhB/YbcL family Raf kinase inhibitor-like protein [Terriglobia bacterium]|jgi:Raf kinase inhibitor-like YbhB/YbcL family protein|nr:YbhB/YbcL family Raf kinase inhibitor-like protein [Terriglobia bacterium]